jgi:methyltransferase (TIGR00027 family)
MAEQSPSRTAYATAFMRALHIAVDAAPPVFNDPIAIELLPRYLRLFIDSQAGMSGWRRRLRPADPAGTAMRSQIVVRARYAEDCLAEARASGASRYVILGAGLDTYTLREREPHIGVLEIDHPATQNWKRRLLRERGFDLPISVDFLPMDFENASLTDAWIDNSSADFISWLGTTYYLSREGIADTLAQLAACTRPGSQLVLDFWREPSDRVFNPLLWGTRIAVALQGEPMRSFFAPDEIEELAGTAGWRVLENCSPAEQTSRYLAGRSDRLWVPSFAYLLRLER